MYTFKYTCCSPPRANSPLRESPKVHNLLDLLVQKYLTLVIPCAPPRANSLLRAAQPRGRSRAPAAGASCTTVFLASAYYC